MILSRSSVRLCVSREGEVYERHKSRGSLCEDDDLSGIIGRDGDLFIICEVKFKVEKEEHMILMHKFYYRNFNMFCIISNAKVFQRILLYNTAHKALTLHLTVNLKANKGKCIATKKLH